MKKLARTEKRLAKKFLGEKLFNEKMPTRDEVPVLIREKYKEDNIDYNSEYVKLNHCIDLSKNVKPNFLTYTIAISVVVLTIFQIICKDPTINILSLHLDKLMALIVFIYCISAMLDYFFSMSSLKTEAFYKMCLNILNQESLKSFNGYNNLK